MIEKANEVADLLKVLSNENRLLIICNLLEKPMNVKELGEILEHLSQPALSQHLSILKSNKLISSQKKGLIITYSIADDRIKNVIKVLKDNYC